MKKFLAILVVLALTVISSVALAEISITGTTDIRNLSINNTTLDGKAVSRTTQERLRLNIDAKTENVKGRITVENDWDVWGTEFNTTTSGPLTSTSLEARQGQSTGKTLGFREAWMEFDLPGLPVNIKAGHQFLSVGNGWFFRNNKYGSDAWRLGNTMDNNTLAIIDVKISEQLAASTDDVDAYVLVDVYKLNDTNVFGADVSYINDAKGKLLGGTKAALMNIGLNYNGKIGPVNLKAEIDLQSGTSTKGYSTTTDASYGGSQYVIQANMSPMDDLTVNATLASGSGDGKADKDKLEYVNFLDADPHYTFVYEYLLKTAAGLKYTGFANTQAIGVGANYVVSKSLSMNLDIWMLSANEKVALNGATTKSLDLGTEVDVKINWKLYETLSWNWTFGRLMPGAAYNAASTTDAAGKSTDSVDAVQGVLSYKF